MSGHDGNNAVMRRSSILITGLILLTLATLLGLAVGSSALTPFDLLRVFSGTTNDADWARTVLMDVRLPRVLLALAMGACLAQSGVVLQALYRNPLAETSLLGISGGAALTAAAWLILLPLVHAAPVWLLPLSLPIVALLGALLAAASVIRFSRISGATDVATLLLAGISINALAGAGIALLQTLSSDAALRDLTVWFYGSLGRASWTELAIGLPVLFAIALWLPREAAALDALLLGEAEAAHIGISIEPLKRRLLLMVTLTAAISVALAGIIGFIGLIVPHLLRQLIGPSHRLLLPAAGLVGATLLVLADTAARTVLAPLEVPVGVLTALIGVPLFLLLLRKGHSA